MYYKDLEFRENDLDWINRIKKQRNIKMKEYRFR